MKTDNPYYPLSHAEMVAIVIRQCNEINDLLMPLPHKLIPTLYMHDAELRARIKRVIRAAYFLSIHTQLNVLLPWADFDLAAMAERRHKEEREKWCQERGIRNVSHCTTPERSEL